MLRTLTYHYRSSVRLLYVFCAPTRCGILPSMFEHFLEHVLEATHHATFALPLLVALGLGAQWLAAALKLPAILPLLLVGFLVGPLTGWLHPAQVLGKTGLSALTSLAVGIILFEGGLTLSAKDIAGQGRTVLRLISWGAVLTWGLAAAAAHLIVGLPLSVSALFGALVIVTGPTVIAPLLRNVRPNANVSNVLRWEGILIDPVGALAAAVAFEWIRAQGSGEAVAGILMHILAFVVVGTVVGLAMGYALSVALRRHWLPDHLINPMTLGWVLLGLALSNALVEESGLLATTVMGMVIANTPVPHREGVLNFKEELVTVLLSTLFVALSANVAPESLRSMLTAQPLMLLAALVLLVRPISVFISTIHSGLSVREKLFIAYLGPRGIVAAAVSGLFAARLADIGVAGADTLVTLVFTVIVGTVVLASLTAKPVARALGVAGADPTGFLLVGAHPLARDLAGALQDAEVPVTLADTNRENVAQARLQGLRAYYGSPLSERAAEDMNLEGVGALLALTPNDEANALAAHKFAKEFGRANIYQLAPDRPDSRTQLADDATGRSAFLPLDEALPTYQTLTQRYLAGAKVRRTKLTESYTLDDYRRDHPSAVLLLSRQDGIFRVITDEKMLEGSGDLITLA